MVSIRAPARGATKIWGRVVRSYEFQFALPRGERRGVFRIVDKQSLFQFALPRGERPTTNSPPAVCHRFNSRSREGSDSGFAASPQSVLCFNSRSREGSDPSMPTLQRLTGSFNSRSREGSDITRRERVGRHDVSIRAPARGATCATPTTTAASCVSIRAPARGATDVAGVTD